MGSTGAFLKTGGFNYRGWEETNNMVSGIKVLRKIVEKNNEKQSLPPRSNTPGTGYALFNSNGEFSQYRQYGEDRKPVFDIEYNEHKHVLSLHIHYYVNGVRQKEPHVIAYNKGDIRDKQLYNKYKKLLKGTEFYEKKNSRL